MVLKRKSTNYIVSVQCLLLSLPTCNSEVKLSSISRAEVRRAPTVIQVTYMVNVTPTGQISWSEMHLHKKTAWLYKFVLNFHKLAWYLTQMCDQLWCILPWGSSCVRLIRSDCSHALKNTVMLSVVCVNRVSFSHSECDTFTTTASIL